MSDWSDGWGMGSPKGVQGRKTDEDGGKMERGEMIWAAKSRERRIAESIER